MKVPGDVVGYYTAAVALMELVAVGARPIMLANTLSVNPEPWGQEILKGVGRAAGHFNNLGLTGSMEKNTPVTQTGVGVVAIGIATRIELNRVPWPGDLLVAVGHPLVGESVLTHPESAMDIGTMLRLRNLEGVSMITPCGSGGAAPELIYYPGLRLDDSLTFPLEHSAGPSTCVLTACRPDCVEHIKALGKPVCVIGYLEGE
jgi:hypothetical protein